MGSSRARIAKAFAAAPFRLVRVRACACGARGLCASWHTPFVAAMASSKLKPFTEADLNADPKDVKLGKELGKGNFSKVFKGTYREKSVRLIGE